MDEKKEEKRDFVLLSNPSKKKLETPVEKEQVKKPRLSTGLRNLKFMSRRKKPIKTEEVKYKVPLIKPKTNKQKSNQLICRPLKRSILHLKAIGDNKTGRKSFGAFNSTLERMQASQKDVSYIDKHAISIEEMADFKNNLNKNAD